LFGGYGLALPALALVLFGAYDSYPNDLTCSVSVWFQISRAYFPAKQGDSLHFRATD